MCSRSFEAIRCLGLAACSLAILTPVQAAAGTVDIAITALQAPSMGVIGGHITGLTVSLQNLGAVDAPAFRVRFYIGRSPTVTASDIDTTWYCSFGGLAAGGKVNCGGEIGIPDGLAPATYYLAAIADPGNALGDPNLGNNTRISDSGPITLATRVAGTFDPSDGSGPLSTDLEEPYAARADNSGNVYIADTLNNRVRKVTAAGVVTTVLGNGNPAQAGDLGWLDLPEALNLDASGNLYVVDTGHHRVLKVTPSGTVTRFAGTGVSGYNGDNVAATSATLSYPDGICFDASGNAYIADWGNGRVRKVNTAGVISTMATIDSPFGIAADGQGNIYVSDNDNHVVRKISAGGAISVYAGNGSRKASATSGTANTVAIGDPSGLAMDDQGNLYIADWWNNLIWKVDSTARATIFAGTINTQGFAGDGSYAWNAVIDSPTDIGLDRNGNAYIADSWNNCIRKVSMQGIMSTFAGSRIYGFDGDGPDAARAFVFYPGALAADVGGNLYVADTGNRRVRKITPSKSISTIAGNGYYGDTGDGGPATAASFNSIDGIALDRQGNLYISDAGAARVRKVSANGTITSFVGTGSAGNNGNSGAGASFQVSGPGALAADASGNLYIADVDNCRILRATPDGRVTTYAGTGVFGASNPGDNGPATAATVRYVNGLTVDQQGNLYLADENRIRKISPQGIITAFAGWFDFGFSGDNGLATLAILANPSALAADSAGNIYVVDRYNQRVRMIDNSGKISTILGNGHAGFAVLNYPLGIAVDPAGGLWVSDQDNHRILKTIPPAAVVPSINSSGVVNGVSLSPGPVAAGSLVSISGTNLASAKAAAPNVPLPVTLNGTEVLMNGIAAPLMSVSPTQIQAQVPWETAAAASLETQVVVNGIGSNKVTVTLAAIAPALASAGGSVAAYHADSSAVTTSSPARFGENLTLSGTGFGAVTNQPPSGSPPKSDTSLTITPPVILVDGNPASVVFAGLMPSSAPSSVGMYRIVIQVPTGVSLGASAAISIQGSPGAGNASLPATPFVFAQGQTGNDGIAQVTLAGKSVALRAIDSETGNPVPGVTAFLGTSGSAQAMLMLQDSAGRYWSEFVPLDLSSDGGSKPHMAYASAAPVDVSLNRQDADGPTGIDHLSTIQVPSPDLGGQQTANRTETLQNLLEAAKWRLGSGLLRFQTRDMTLQEMLNEQQNGVQPLLFDDLFSNSGLGKIAIRARTGGDPDQIQSQQITGVMANVADYWNRARARLYDTYTGGCYKLDQKFRVVAVETKLPEFVAATVGNAEFNIMIDPLEPRKGSGCGGNDTTSDTLTGIWGYVYATDGGTKHPLESVAILALGKTPRKAYTASDGLYQIGGIQAGTYLLQASALGYRHSTFQIEAKSSDLMKYDLELMPLLAKDIQILPDWIGCLAPGGLIRLQAIVKDGQGNVLGPQPVVQWSSQQPYVAVVDRDGWVTPIQSGYADITASVFGIFASVEVGVGGPAVIPVSFDFTAFAGAANPDPKTLNISNAGVSVGWTARADSSWIRLKQTSGMTPSTIEVSVDITGLAAGPYKGNITIGAVGGCGATVPVNLTVSGGNKLSVTLEGPGGQSAHDSRLASFPRVNPADSSQAYGSVKSDPPGIDCPSSACSAVFPGSVTNVDLTASFAPGFVFSGWAGDCSGSERVCHVPMDQDRNVTARFAAAPPVALGSLALSSNSVTGGNSVTGTVTLSAAAPPGGTDVALQSSDAAAPVPAKVTVQAGQTSATFTITTKTVTAQKSITVTASLNGVSKTATLNVNPAAPALAFHPLATLPQGTVGVAYPGYSFCQPAPTTGLCGTFPPTTDPTGGVPPYHFQVDTMSTAPMGMFVNQNGLLTGTPSAAGTYNFRVCAVDTVGASSCQPTSITIVVASTAGTYAGAYDRSTTGTEGACVWNVRIQATITARISGSGTAASPYSGTATASGTATQQPSAGNSSSCSFQWSPLGLAGAWGNSLQFSQIAPIPGSAGTVEWHGHAEENFLCWDFVNGRFSGSTLSGTLSIDGTPILDNIIVSTLTLTRQ